MTAGAAGHEEHVLQTGDGVSLFAQTWSSDGAPTGVVCLVHGIGDHSGRYGHLCSALVHAGYAVVGFDLRGHGRSDVVGVTRPSARHGRYRSGPGRHERTLQLDPVLSLRTQSGRTVGSCLRAAARAGPYRGGGFRTRRAHRASRAVRRPVSRDPQRAGEAADVRRSGALAARPCVASGARERSAGNDQGTSATR